MMAASPLVPSLTREQREVLELLASDPQGAREELLVLLLGFDSDMIARARSSRIEPFIRSHGRACPGHLRLSS